MPLKGANNAVRTEGDGCKLGRVGCVQGVTHRKILEVQHLPRCRAGQIRCKRTSKNDSLCGGFACRVRVVGVLGGGWRGSSLFVSTSNICASKSHTSRREVDKGTYSCRAGEHDVSSPVNIHTFEVGGAIAPSKIERYERSTVKDCSHATVKRSIDGARIGDV
jgi:hypothetical protein